MKASILSIWNQIIRSTFVRQVLSLGSGVIVAHAITLAVSPLITRIYTPEEFGLFSLFNSLVVVLTLIATGTYEYSIVLPKEDRVAVSLFKVSICSTLLFTAGCYLLLFPAAPYVSDLTALSIPFLMLVPLGVLFHSAMGSFTYWFNRNEYFDEFARAKISMAGGTGLIQLGIGFAGATSVGLLIGLIAGRIFSVGTMAIQKTNQIKQLFCQWSKTDMVNAASKYSDHPKFVLLSSLLSSVAIEIPVFLITSLFGSQELGFYGLAIRVLMAPVTLVSMSVGHVYFQKFAARKHQGMELAPYILKLWSVLFLVGIVPFSLLFLFSEQAFSFIFGESWVASGTVAAILSPMLFFMFLTNPTSKSLLVLDKQRVMPLFSASFLIVRLGTLLTGYYYFDFFTALVMMVIGQVVVYVLQGIYILITARKRDLGTSNRPL